MIEGFYYDYQVKRAILQFAAIFSGMTVSVGANKNRDATTIPVPVMIGSMDRVAAAIATRNTQNAHIRVPVMSVNVTALRYAADRAKGISTEQRGIDVPYGGDPRLDGTVVYQKMALPYDIMVDLKIKTSNKDQQFQIFEQIALLFSPTLQIQTSDGLFDPGKIVAVELADITIDDNFPSGMDSRTCEMTISFKIDAYLQMPGRIRDNLIQTVLMRVMAVNDPHIGTVHSDGRDNEQVPYIFDAENVPEIMIKTSDEVTGV